MLEWEETSQVAIFNWLEPHLNSLIPNLIQLIASFLNTLLVNSNDVAHKMQEQKMVRWTQDFTSRTPKETYAIFVEWDKTFWYETYYAGCENRAPPYLKSAYDQALVGFCMTEPYASDVVRFLRKYYNKQLDSNATFLRGNISTLDEYTLGHLTIKRSFKQPIKALFHHKK